LLRDRIFTKLPVSERSSGGIGRRAGLKIQWALNPCRFDPGLEYDRQPFSKEDGCICYVARRFDPFMQYRQEAGVQQAHTSLRRIHAHSKRQSLCNRNDELIDAKFLCRFYRYIEYPMSYKLKLEEEHVTEILTDFLCTHFAEAGFKRAVIGLSGGVDSALSAVLSAKALGAENVRCISLPYRSSSPESVEHARILAEAFSMKLDVIDITPTVDAVIDIDPAMDRLRRGNIMARMRMIVLYDASARDQALVIGTGNKTEALLGYTTLYGDSACAVNPIGNLYKTQVWQLARYLGIPDTIVEKAPSADLWTGQTDEEELGFTYEHVDSLLYYLVDHQYDDAQLIGLGFEHQFIDTVRSLIRKNQFKRRMPPVATLSVDTV
jgi:NAD+ synthase